MDKDKLRERVESDPDFIVAPRYNNSLQRLVREQSDVKPAKGVDPTVVPRTVARMLQMTPEEAVEVRQKVLDELREEVER